MNGYSKYTIYIDFEEGGFQNGIFYEYYDSISAAEHDLKKLQNPNSRIKALSKLGFKPDFKSTKVCIRGLVNPNDDEFDWDWDVL